MPRTTKVKEEAVDELDFDFSKAGKRWVAYFDRLGFGEFTKENDLVDVFFEISDRWLEIAKDSPWVQEYVELVWFSDTILFYSTDDSMKSYYAIDEASRMFFDECLQAEVPVRGALSLGEFYADRANSLFLGRALVDAYQYGERFNWLGFVLHKTALEKMKELVVKDNLSCYKEWKAEVKEREPNTFSQESVVAYLPGPGSVHFKTDDNRYRPYLDSLDEMLRAAKCEEHKRKYGNTKEFIQHFAALDGTLTVASSLP
jgi:hypothetical protein